MENACLICDRITLIQKGENSHFVKEFSTGYVVLGDNQFYKGLTFFLAKQHASELHELDKPYRNLFLSEMADVAHGVYKAFHPRKLNYELLGNKEKHLHWWIIPRHFDDPKPDMPIWSMNKKELWNTKPSREELKISVKLLRNNLEQI